MLSSASLLLCVPPEAIRPQPRMSLATEPTQSSSHTPAASAPSKFATSDSATRAGIHLRASRRARAFRPPSSARPSPSPTFPLAVTTSHPPFRTGTGSYHAHQIHGSPPVLCRPCLSNPMCWTAANVEPFPPLSEREKRLSGWLRNCSHSVYALGAWLHIVTRPPHSPPTRALLPALTPSQSRDGRSAGIGAVHARGGRRERPRGRTDPLSGSPGPPERENEGPQRT